jgi:hypothetical protein
MTTTTTKPYWRGIDNNADGRNNVTVTNPQSDVLEIIREANETTTSSTLNDGNGGGGGVKKRYTNYIRTLFFDTDAPVPAISGASFMLLKLMATSADFISARVVAIAHFVRAFVSIAIFPLIAYTQYALVVERLPLVANAAGAAVFTDLIAAVARDLKIGCALTVASGLLTFYLACVLWTGKNGKRHIEKRDMFHSCMTIAAATLDVTGVFMMRRKFVSDHAE